MLPRSRAFLRIPRPLLFTTFLVLLPVCTQDPPDTGDEEQGDNEVTVLTPAGRCGVERWSVKTGTDGDAGKINLTPVAATVAGLGALPKPGSLPANNRIAPTELQAFQLTNVILTEYKLEADSDYHLVLSDGTHTMIAEIPMPGCVGAGSPLLAGITAARQAFDAKFTVTTSFQTANIPVTLTGIGFFDSAHGQTGVAPNAIELHPVVSICFGTDCAAGHPHDMSVSIDLAQGSPDLSGGKSDLGGNPDLSGGRLDLGGSPDLSGGKPDLGGSPDLASGGHIQTVFLILMENTNWSQIKGSSSAPYINSKLLPMASYATNYQNSPGIHPSLPNYLWLEAGTNFGILADGVPSKYHQSTTQHLVTLLKTAGVTWRAYEENISGTSCPLTASGLYAPKHLGMIFFDDVTNTNKTTSMECISHIRPYPQLATDLSGHTTAQYNFITPNLCNDMHNLTGCPTSDHIRNGDNWLSTEIPKLMASDAYKNNGAIFITWDESEGGDVPIGMIVLSPLAKGGGYSNSIAYTHSSTLRTMQEIFTVTPFLGDAAHATDLADLFTAFP